MPHNEAAVLPLWLEWASSRMTAKWRPRCSSPMTGAMRNKLTALLDYIGLQRWLGQGSCDELFGKATHLLQSASVLPFPVFVNAGNYNGTPDPLNTPMLRKMAMEHFVPMANALPAAVFVPLGPVPTRVLQWLVSQDHMSERQLLLGLPHPSGANAGRVRYFLGKKAASLLSVKTDAVRLAEARLRLQATVASLAQTC